MGFQVICISRTIAAGGEAIGQAVAQRLGYRYVDAEVVTKAAEKAKVDPRVVAASEQKQPFLKRLIEAIGSAQGAADPLGFATGLPLDVYQQTASLLRRPAHDALRALIRATVREIAQEGRAVIVAHAASFALAGTPGVFRVLVTASPETRVDRLAAAQHIDTTAAQAAVAQSDRERRNYFYSFYKIKDELPTHYDLVISTDVLTPEQATALIICAAQS